MAEDEPRAAGWKKDPKAQHYGRYWDGSAWTERVHAGDREGVDPIAHGYPEPGTPAHDAIPDVMAGRPAEQQRVQTLEEQIEDLASRKLDMRLGVGREIKALASHIHDGEHLITMARGGLSGATGIIVVTDQRVLFLDKRLTGHNIEDFPLRAITSISAGKSMMYAKLRIHIGSHSSEITHVFPKERAQEIADAVRHAQKAATSSPSPLLSALPPAAAAPGPSVLDQLEQLGRLRQSGVLSDEEFEEQKRRILAGQA